MSKLLRATLLSAYGALFMHFLKSYMSNFEETIELSYIYRTPGTLRKIEREIKRNKNITKIDANFKKREVLPTDYKYILKWSEAFSQNTLKTFRNGQKSFFENNCTYNNCYLTNDKSLLIDLRNFDAILFDVEYNWDRKPPIRASYQKYIFVAPESSEHYPICSRYFEDFYNWTWTYKLDAEIRWTFFTILDKQDNVVGPKINMTWVTPMEPIPKYVKKKIRTKKTAVAWFESDCTSKKRLKVAKDLANSLSKYKLKLDVYGLCGNKTCPGDRIEDCLAQLQKSYYFYLAFEDSWAEDYVTEIILFPLLHYAVPVVYGGADYSRFLPPGSYIDAGKLNSEELASTIAAAIRDRKIYEDYFRWHNHYVYKESPPEAQICRLCERLNTDSNITIVRNFRRRWNPNYKEKCRHDTHFTDIKYY